MRVNSSKANLRELHKKDDPIVKWFDKGFPQTTLANGEVAESVVPTLPLPSESTLPQCGKPSQ